MTHLRTIFRMLFLSALLLGNQSFGADEDCFKVTFAEARDQFKNLAQEFVKSNPASKLGIEADDGAEIDYLYLENQKKGPLVIIQSGLHGVEGHAGSAIQCVLLRQLQRAPSKSINFLFLHAINADGFQRDRRVNQNNVDLNRNHFDDPKGYLTVNEGYPFLEPFLNPKEQVNLGFFSKAGFILRSVGQILKHSKDTLKRTLLKGQYQYPRDIYFGGVALEPQIRAQLKIWDRFTKAHDNLLLVDLHTGYGERGRLHLLANSSKDKDASGLRLLFEPTAIDFGDQGEFYQTTGDNVTAFVKRFGVDRATGVAFEYGTLNSQSLFGSIDSLYRLILENQGAQYGYANQESELQTKELFLEMFYPSDQAWRQGIVAQTLVEFRKVLDRLGP